MNTRHDPMACSLPLGLLALLNAAAVGLHDGSAGVRVPAAHRRQESECVTGYAFNKPQLDIAPPSSATSGALYAPMMATATAVDGGIRKRMTEEDAALKLARERRR